MRRYLLAGAIVPMCMLLGGGCLSAANESPQSGPPAQSAPGPSQTPGAVAQASPVAPATIDVSPTQVAAGAMSLSLAFEAPRHMQDYAAMLITSSQPQPAAAQPTLTGTPSMGALVLSDMLHVTNNLDPSQPVPPDAAQSIVRQAVVQVLATDTHQLVPYLTVTMDLLLDGHPVSYGQTLVPMVTQEAAGQRVYYGNNVRLPARGTFQAFVRVDRTALLGQDQPGAAQFNLVVR